ncbi:MAG TPA: hypothetical protein VHS31_16735 [Tepidisphaeraceae bacterium]|nr:hypothetical protein [Tepidisphaeraceae bacterium]
MDEPKPIPLSLNYVQPLFLEDRLVKNWWPRALTFLAVSLFLLAAFEGSLAFVFWYRIPQFARIAWLVAVLIFVSLPIFLSRLRAITVLEPAELQIRLLFASFILWRRTIRLIDVRGIEEVKNYNYRSVLKIHLDMTEFMTGAMNVRVKLDGRAYVIGSANPDELYEQLRKAVEKPS